MGSCSSVHTATRLFVPSPRKKKPLNGENHPVKMVGSGFSLKSPEFGSKEGMVRLRIDCIAKMMISSVSTESPLRPEAGSTPNNQTSTLSTPKSNKPFSFDKFLDTKSKPSPTGRKKLADLFQETSQLKECF